MADHPIFGDVTSTDAERQAKRDAVAAELRRLMELRWRQPGCSNARRTARYTMPMKLGGTWGYYDVVQGW